MRSWYRGRQRWGEGRKGGLLEEGPRKINKGRSIGLGKKKKKNTSSFKEPNKEENIIVMQKRSIKKSSLRFAMI